MSRRHAYSLFQHDFVRLTLAAGLVAVSGTVMASGMMGQKPMEPSIKSVTPAEMAGAALDVEHQGDVTYVSGGIGVDERAWMSAHAKAYNARLTFAQVPGGAFLSDVQVSLTPVGGGRTTTITTNGPMLYMQLPAGRYRLTAMADGSTAKRTLSVPAHGGRHWVIGLHG